MQKKRLGVVTGTQLGSAFIDGLREGLAATKTPADLSLLMALHPSQMPATVGYADVNHRHAEAFARTQYVSSAKSPEFERTVLGEALDFLLVVSFSQLIPQSVLTAMTLARPDRGHVYYEKACIGAHPTALPAGRGRAPIPWTLINGLTRSALTTFVLGEGADDGPIIQQLAFDVNHDDDASSLYAKVAELHRIAGVDLASRLSTGELVAVPQNEALASTWGKRTPADGHIRASMTVDEVCRLVRASQSPYPPAFIVAGSEILYVTGTQPASAASPGRLSVKSGELIELGLVDGAVCLRLRAPIESPAAWLDNLLLP